MKPSVLKMSHEESLRQNGYTVCSPISGSMKPSNAKGLMEQPEIDGGLIGGASLKAEDFAKVVHFDA